MLLAFFESIKYVGHLYPIAFLRIYVGYYWFNFALTEYKSGLFASQVFIDELKSSDIFANFPSWYQGLFENLIYSNWQIVGHAVLVMAFLVGLSLIIGFMVRPFCIVGILMCLHFILINQSNVALLYSTFVAIFITLMAAGAGRCVGFDYYFFKRNRGLWW